MLLKNIEEILKKPLIVSRFLQKLDTSKKPDFWVVFGGTRKLHKINMHFFGGQKKYAKKYAFLEADPGEQKFQFYTVKCIFFAYFFQKLKDFSRLMQKICILRCKIKIFASQGLPPKMHIFFWPPKKCIFFLRIFFLSPKTTQKNAYFSGPSKKMHDCFRFLAFAPIFFKNPQCSSKHVEHLGDFFNFSSLSSKKAIEHLKDFFQNR